MPAELHWLVLIPVLTPSEANGIAVDRFEAVIPSVCLLKLCIACIVFRVTFKALAPESMRETERKLETTKASLCAIVLGIFRAASAAKARSHPPPGLAQFPRTLSVLKTSRARG